MTTLDLKIAQRIIQQLGSSGQPPEVGVQYFSVGLDDYLAVIDEEYLSSFIQEGGSAFKLVVGVYGGGKTHFLYCVRDKGWAHNFAVSYVSLKSGGECPFDKLDLVYKAIVSGLLPPITNLDVPVEDAKGVENFLRYWYMERWTQYKNAGKSNDAIREAIRDDIEAIAAANVDSTSFRNAVVRGLQALASGDERVYPEICQWLKGEGPPTPQLKRMGITQKVERSTAFGFIRSLGQIVRALGYHGLLVLLDEAESVPSMGRKQRDQLLSNLREFIDECGKTTFKGIMVFYAVPDRGFLDGRTQVYEALRQRLSTTFAYLNPTGVAIELDEVTGDPEEFLIEVGSKIVPIYNAANEPAFTSGETEPIIQHLAKELVQIRFADTGYKREFVKQLVTELNKLHREGRSDRTTSR